MSAGPTATTPASMLASQPSITALWLRYRVVFIATCLTLLGGGLRLFHAGAESLRLDEVWTLWLARQNTGDMVRKILFEGVDSTPPTYYLFVHPFLTLSQDPVSLRLVTIIAGTLTVWLTFRLALYLFDLRVAAVSGLLMALAPMHIEYSQVARAYALSTLFALASVYFFARLLFGDRNRWYWVAFVLSTAAALLTFYLVVLVVLFENAVMGFLWLRRKLSRQLTIHWIVSQVAVALFIVPVSFAIFINIGPNTGHNWLPRPNVASLIKTSILFTTGDPSEGPTGVTVPRIISTLVIGAILALGAWLLLRSRGQLTIEDRYRALFVTSAALIPWAVAFVISQKSSIYHEKYLLFILPCLLVAMAWVFVRSARMLAAPVVLVSLLALTTLALVVYYSTPSGEQWRETVNYMRPRLQAGDTVLISPGYYAFPFAYYSSGHFPDDIRALAHKPVVEIKDGKFVGLDAATLIQEAGPAGNSGGVSAGLGGRAWVISGYTSPDTGLGDWLQHNFTLLDAGRFVGAQAVLMQPARH